MTRIPILKGHEIFMKTMSRQKLVTKPEQHHPLTLKLQFLVNFPTEDRDTGVVPLKHQRAKQSTRRCAVSIAH